jgi:hypothetical protein
MWNQRTKSGRRRLAKTSLGTLGFAEDGSKTTLRETQWTIKALSAVGVPAICSGMCQDQTVAGMGGRLASTTLIRPSLVVSPLPSEPSSRPFQGRTIDALQALGARRSPEVSSGAAPDQ